MCSEEQDWGDVVVEVGVFGVLGLDGEWCPFRETSFCRFGFGLEFGLGLRLSDPWAGLECFFGDVDRVDNLGDEGFFWLGVE